MMHRYTQPKIRWMLERMVERRALDRSMPEGTPLRVDNPALVFIDSCWFYGVYTPAALRTGKISIPLVRQKYPEL